MSAGFCVKSRVQTFYYRAVTQWLKTQTHQDVILCATSTSPRITTNCWPVKGVGGHLVQVYEELAAVFECGADAVSRAAPRSRFLLQQPLERLSVGGEHTGRTQLLCVGETAQQPGGRNRKCNHAMLWYQPKALKHCLKVALRQEPLVDIIHINILSLVERLS